MKEHLRAFSFDIKQINIPLMAKPSQIHILHKDPDNYDAKRYDLYLKRKRQLFEALEKNNIKDFEEFLVPMILKKGSKQSDEEFEQVLITIVKHYKP